MLHGLLAQIGDMGVPLLAVNRIELPAEGQEGSEGSAIHSRKEKAGA